MYSWFQNSLAVPGARAQAGRLYIRAREGDTVLDVGCGPADTLEFLPRVTYVGIDLSAKYLARARQRYHAHPSATFLQMDARALAADWTGRFDLVLAQGLLHHLTDDEAVSLLSTLRLLMRPAGRLVTVDPAYVEGQGYFARLLVSSDRGRFVRWVHEYQALVGRVFPDVVTHVRHDVLRLPYTHLIMECSGETRRA